MAERGGLQRIRGVYRERVAGGEQLWRHNGNRHSEQERTILFRDKPVVLFPAVSDPVGEPLIGEVEAPYDRQWYTDWLRALMHGITANADFDGRQIRNPQQNKRLYDILQAFKG